jgi:hypothetical protein
MLQPEAGYIDARPRIRQLDEVLLTARPDHTFRSFSTKGPPRRII